MFPLAYARMMIVAATAQENEFDRVISNTESALSVTICYCWQF